MTTEERLSRIENALIAGGLMDPNPTLSIEEIKRDMAAGNLESLRAYMRRNHSPEIRRDVWPFAPIPRLVRKKKQAPPSA